MEGVEGLGFWTKERTLKMAYVSCPENAQENWIRKRLQPDWPWTYAISWSQFNIWYGMRSNARNTNLFPPIFFVVIGNETIEETLRNNRWVYSYIPIKCPGYLRRNEADDQKFSARCKRSNQLSNACFQIERQFGVFRSVQESYWILSHFICYQWIQKSYLAILEENAPSDFP